MRGQQTWAGVKPVLKVLQEAFPAKVHNVYILKPDNFWQKQKASLGSSKYTFEVRPICSAKQGPTHLVIFLCRPFVVSGGGIFMAFS